MKDREKDQQNRFIETLREVEKIARISPDGLDREEIMGYFQDAGLTEAQKNMVFEYLLTARTDKEEPDGTDQAEGNAPEADGAGRAERNAPEGDGADQAEGNAPEGDEAGRETGAAGRPQNPSKALQLYLDELTRLPEYTHEERQRLYEELLEGGGEAVRKLSEGMLREVVALAAGYASDSVGLEDLIQEGNLGIFIRLNELCGMGADCGYDVEEELEGAADDAMRAYVSEVTGETDSENTVVGRMNLVNEAVRFLRGQNGREPSARELAEYTGMSERELQDILSLCRRPAVE